MAAESRGVGLVGLVVLGSSRDNRLDPSTTRPFRSYPKPADQLLTLDLKPNLFSDRLEAYSQG